MEVLQTFITTYCLVGSNEIGERYRVKGPLLCDTFNNYIVTQGIDKVSSQVFYGLLNGLSEHIERVQRSGGYSIQGITLRNNVDTFIPKPRHADEVGRVDARRST
jgi:hypothetical protein